MRSSNHHQIFETLYWKITYNEPPYQLRSRLRSHSSAGTEYRTTCIENKCTRNGTTKQKVLEELKLHRTVAEIASFFFSSASADDVALAQLITLSIAFVHSDSNRHSSSSSDGSDESDEDRVETQGRARETRLQQGKRQMYGEELYELQQERFPDTNRKGIHELEQWFLESSPSPIKYVREKLLHNETVP